MEEKEFDSMNILPLVDVMLVLLTIVLTTATFVAKGLIPVDLPAVEKHNASPHAERPKTVVEISREGKIFLGIHQIQLADIKAQTADIPRQQSIIIRADKKIHLELFVEVLSKLKRQGFVNISLQTEEKS